MRAVHFYCPTSVYLYEPYSKPRRTFSAYIAVRNFSNFCKFTNDFCNYSRWFSDSAMSAEFWSVNTIFKFSISHDLPPFVFVCRRVLQKNSISSKTVVPQERVDSCQVSLPLHSLVSFKLHSNCRNVYRSEPAFHVAVYFVRIKFFNGCVPRRS